MARRFGWHSGNVHALNVQTGTVDITTDQSGDGSQAVTYKHTMDNIPSVVLTPAEVMTTGVLSVTDGNISGFTAEIANGDVTSSTLTVNWIAIDQTK